MQVPQSAPKPRCSQPSQITDTCPLPSLAPPSYDDCRSLNPQTQEPESNPVTEAKSDTVRQKATDNNSSALTPRQRKALPMVVSSTSLAQAARDADVHRATLHRWMEDDKFREELVRLRQEAVELARSELQELMLVSVAVLADAMENAASHDVRVRAARTALSFGMQLNEMKKLREEIDTLQDALKIWQTHYSKL